MILAEALLVYSVPAPIDSEGPRSLSYAFASLTSARSGKCVIRTLGVRTQCRPAPWAARQPPANSIHAFATLISALLGLCPVVRQIGDFFAFAAAAQEWLPVQSFTQG